MKQLPKYFVIRRDKNNPLWDEFLDWVKITYDEFWAGESYYYYGYDGNPKYSGTNGHDKISEFENNPTLITLEEWNECVNRFVLPERWCIKITEESVDDVADFYAKHAWNGYKKLMRSEMNKYYHSHNLASDNSIFGKHPGSNFDAMVPRKGYIEITFDQFKEHVLRLTPETKSVEFTLPEKWAVKVTSENVEVLDKWKKTTEWTDHASEYEYITYDGSGDDILRRDYTEITFEQFEKYVLSKSSEMEKKIIGYRLIKPEYEEAVLQIIKVNWGTPKYFISAPTCIKDLKEAGVLDIWFEPVYEEEFKVGDWVYFEGSYHKDGPYKLAKKLSNGEFEDTNGGYRSIRSGNYRFATPEEILEYKVKEFTAKTGIKVGDMILAPDRISGEICWDDNDNEWRASMANDNRKVLEFRMHPDNETLLMQVEGTMPYVWFDAYKMKPANTAPSITIKGYEAKFTEDSVTFGCQTYGKAFVLTLAECLEENNFNMEIKNEILEIANYFKNR